MIMMGSDFENPMGITINTKTGSRLTKDGAAERLLDAIEQLCLKKAVKP